MMILKGKCVVIGIDVGGINIDVVVFNFDKDFVEVFVFYKIFII